MPSDREPRGAADDATTAPPLHRWPAAKRDGLGGGNRGRRWLRSGEDRQGSAGGASHAVIENAGNASRFRFNRGKKVVSGAAGARAQPYLRTSSMTLPSLGSVPGATSSTAPRSLVTAPSDSATAVA